MCGIYGIVQRGSGDIPCALAGGMRDSLRHRGPDHAGSYCQPGITMGVDRLAIVDLTAGNQPMFNHDRSLVIVYNGELYNHLDIRKELEGKGHVFTTRADTETVLHAFEEYGHECLQRFNGMFAFAVWNTRSRSLFLARDRLGIKPLYVAELDEGLAFASEAKALLPLLPGGPRCDWTAIYRYFSFGYVPAPQSPFVGVKKFPAGHYACVEAARVIAQRYWTPQYGMGADIPLDQASATLDKLLDRAVRMELMSDVPVGIFLSGGLDSSAVAVYARKNCATTPHSFALRFPESTHDESADARRVAKHLGLHHHEFTFSEDHLQRALARVAETLDEPFGDSTVLPLLTLSEQAREHVSVVLTGWGGDEIFVGYPTYKAHQLAQAYRKLPRVLIDHMIPAVVNRLPVSDKYMSLEFKAKRFIRGMNMPPEHQHFLWMGYFTDSDKARLLTPRILEEVEGATLDGVSNVVSDLTEDNLIDRIMHLDALYFLEGNGLFQADRIPMAVSLEARVPLLNHDVLTFVNALPVSVKAKGGRLKNLLRTTLSPYLPKDIVNKPKKGFGPPAAAWMRGPLAKTTEDLFARARVEDQGILNFTEIQRLISEHRERKADHGRALWALMSFQLWYDKWILCGHALQNRPSDASVGAQTTPCVNTSREAMVSA